MADLRQRLEQAKQNAATSDSTRAARQRQTLSRPLSDYTGRFGESSYGEISLRVRDGKLEYSWGVLRGPVEILNAANHQLRFEIAGTGMPLTFTFDGAGPARSVEIPGITFTRIP